MAEDMQTCQGCSQQIGTYTPKGGDGSQSYIRVHNVRTKVRCGGSKRPSEETK